MSKCLWCGKKIVQSRKCQTNKLYCNASCKSSMTAYRRHLRLSKEINKYPNKFVKKQLDNVIIKPVKETRLEKMKKRIDNKYFGKVEIEKNVNLPTIYPQKGNQMSEQKRKMLDMISNLKPGENLRFKFENLTNYQINSLRTNFYHHIKKRKIKNVFISKRKNALYFIKEDESKE